MATSLPVRTRIMRSWIVHLSPPLLELSQTLLH